MVCMVHMSNFYALSLQITQNRSSVWQTLLFKTTMSIILKKNNCGPNKKPLRGAPTAEKSLQTHVRLFPTQFGSWPMSKHAFWHDFVENHRCSTMFSKKWQLLRKLCYAPLQVRSILPAGASLAIDGWLVKYWQADYLWGFLGCSQFDARCGMQ